VRQPIFRQLVLPAVGQDLTKDPVVVTDPITVRGHAERRHALHQAGGEASEPPVAQRRVRLECAHLIEVDAQRLQRFARDIQQSDVRERVEEHAADEELQREVIDPLATISIAALRRLAPAIDHVVAGGEAHGDEPVVFPRVRRLAGDRVTQLGEDRRAERVDVDGRTTDETRMRRIDAGAQAVSGK